MNILFIKNPKRLALLNMVKVFNTEDMTYLDILCIQMLGTSGVLSPYSEMDGLYFDGSPEPDDFMWVFHKAVNEVAKNRGIQMITIDFDTKEDYYNALDDLQGFTADHVSITTTSRENDTSISIVKEPFVDLDDRKVK